MSSLKSIYELVKGNYKFVIPSYQRGYRWTERETGDLLEDILDFIRQPSQENKDNSFYCLQPLVVKRDKNKSEKEGRNVYKVIDGQQRLTTILLILQALKNEIGIPLENIFGISGFYEICYEIRRDSTNFLRNISCNEEMKKQALNNIDFWYMYNNYSIIVNWLKTLSDRTELNAYDFANILLKGKKIVFIWYEVPEEDEIQIFTRLNIGKIPLTNSELIKALFLLPLENEDEKALLISEWDNIETKLQDNKFWGFIYGESNYRKPTRIDILFELVAEDKNIKEVKEAKNRLKNLRKDDERKSFYIFYEALRNKSKETQQKIIKEIWDMIKYYFRILEEFYEDNELYHLIGYLVNAKSKIRTNEVIKQLIEIFQVKNREEFKRFLREKIKKEKIRISKSELRSLSYSEDKEKLENILFLFNIVLTIQANKNLEDEMYLRFPFHLHKSQKWTIEHINPVKPENLNLDEKKEILKNYFENDPEIEDLKSKVEEVLSTDNREKIEKVFNELFDKFSPNESEKDYIGNLTLLSDKLNKKLKNYFFFKKRKIIIEEELNGTYIPLGTKYVFMKYPLKGSKHLVVWDKEDMNEYANIIENTLKDFLKEEENNE